MRYSIKKILSYLIITNDSIKQFWQHFKIKRLKNNDELIVIIVLFYVLAVKLGLPIRINKIHLDVKIWFYVKNMFLYHLTVSEYHTNKSNFLYKCQKHLQETSHQYTCMLIHT